MKVIIAGSRNFTDYNVLLSAINRFQALVGPITEVVSGGAAGADTLGERWARANGIPTRVFKADWRKHGRSAGPIRNQQMADYVKPDGGLIAIQVNFSKGTQNMIDTARTVGLPPNHIQVEEVLDPDRGAEDQNLVLGI